MKTLTTKKTKTWIHIGIITIALLGMLTSCGSDPSDDTGGGDDPPRLVVTFAEVPKAKVTLADDSTIDSVRDRWAFVSLTANRESSGYLVGVKTATDPAPNAEEMVSTDLNVKKYHLSTNAIKVILATRMGTGMFTYFETNTGETNGYVDDELNIDGDIVLTGDNQNLFRNSMLLPSTEYKIYGKEAGSTTVTLLGTITTDPVSNTNVSSSAGTTGSGSDGISSLSAAELINGVNTITIHRDNYEIISLQFFPSDYNAVYLHTYNGGNGFSITIRNQERFNVNPNVAPFNSANTREQFFVVVDGQTAEVAVPRGQFLLLKGGGTLFFDDRIQMSYTGQGVNNFSFSANIQE